MAWSPEQEKALKDIQSWLKDPSGAQVFRLFGYAGTGKTTLAQEIAKNVNGRVYYAAFTGKAAFVLRGKGCKGANTIHSLIYKVDMSEGTPQFHLDSDSPVRGAGLIIVDEVSMVNEELALDLLSFGTRVLVLGDPAQLPPVSGAGFFITGHQPDIMLTEIHRQAKDNPIVRLSLDVREGRKLELGRYETSKVISKKEIDPDEVLCANQVLVGRNNTRQSYNERIRELLGYDKNDPVVGDRLICLKNDRKKLILNGQGFLLDSAPTYFNGNYKMHVLAEDGYPTSSIEVNVPKAFFTGDEDSLDFSKKRFLQQFTYGYAITVHKSQGSQWEHVMVFDESRYFREDRAKHLYTAITRAADRVTVVV